MTNETNTIGEIKGVIQKTQGNQKYLFGTIKSDKVKNVTFVPVIEQSHTTYLNETVEEGYQRPGSASRMREFSKFLSKNPNSVVPPILLSARGNWKFEPVGPEQDSGKLIIQDRAAIVDGQHRLGGFVHLYESENKVCDIAFILLSDLTAEEEQYQFVTVNNSQKGVPKPLTAYLEDKPEAQVGWGLNIESNSPFEGKITRTRMERTHLFALHSVSRQVKRLFTPEGLELDPHLAVEEKIEFMSRYWRIIAEQLKNEWADIEKLDDPEIKGNRRSSFEYKLLELTGFIAWAYTGAHIFRRSYSEESGMNWDNVARLVGAASKVEWRKDGEYKGRTGEVGGKAMATDMIRLLPPESPETRLEQPLS